MSACVALSFGLTQAACTPPNDSASSSDQLAHENAFLTAPVDTARFRSPREVISWPYRREADADLDGDGQRERLLIAADVALDSRGRPAWDDGQRWAVYVQEDDSTLTLLYGRFVQLGVVEASITASPEGPHVTIHERGPHLRVAWEIEYSGPGRVRIVGRVGGSVTRGPDDILELGP